MTTQTPTTARDLQRKAAVTLAGLLTVDLPELSWSMYNIEQFLDSYLKPDMTQAFILNGQAESHQAVREWAAYLNVPVNLRYGQYPTAFAVIDGIGTRVWCAPEFRDDVTDLEG